MYCKFKTTLYVLSAIYYRFTGVLSRVQHNYIHGESENCEKFKELFYACQTAEKGNRDALVSRSFMTFINQLISKLLTIVFVVD